MTYPGNERRKGERRVKRDDDAMYYRFKSGGHAFSTFGRDKKDRRAFRQSELAQARERIKELEDCLLDCAGKLASMGREFCSPNFTDRYGDGPVMLDLASRARALLKGGNDETISRS